MEPHKHDHDNHQPDAAVAFSADRDAEDIRGRATMLSAVVGPELRVLLVILALVVAWGLAIATWDYPP
ncbi:hypothetical protein [uncultured Tateyamaria sp.]|uniref:hypothetical protein n=1 Tax=uncultured Tateyamaria sp. TaxID=455651 RepID=UPI00260E62A1|nr:hypothetical protein [uncultured Tateyamaria sp.]